MDPQPLDHVQLLLRLRLRLLVRLLRQRAVRVDPRLVPRLVAGLQRRLERDGVELEWPHWQPAMSCHSYRVDELLYYFHYKACHMLVRQPDWYWGESAQRP